MRCIPLPTADYEPRAPTCGVPRETIWKAMVVKIADNFEELGKRLSELEMERARQLADRLNEPAEDKNAWPYLGHLAPDYDGA